ncbi:NADH-quinone oxidoreductase subunit G [Stackebrandtia nassauensis]|uniref:NADH-quinone oxidoreductase n=1 Tax=Stackebrandtia nassauensis (strain DSM 44728 / CIP 108903 / NRRL B-16338 / NBRC 102104 / LLR-40K-21) TaxID=446470 RepID=D3PU43_STANL|nr:NADH-quinone oxidoreductase subunit G [Stackebrandtia nassauensis]ADD40989.1 NADH-quinone oxidoreductase, chain G [Stackebrandtia nassauensis DSM 44728]
MTETVTLTIDGLEVTVPKGTLVIRAAEQLGIEIPRFCDHPLLEPAGACRQCLVDVEGQRKPLASCTATCTDGMVVKTQLTSPVAKKAQEGIMEFLLINHPLDCPMCDKGGECPLQNQAMSTGRTESRFTEQKRTFKKAKPISSQVLLDRERCVLCQRCTRFSDEIAGDPFIDLMERSSQEQIGTAEGEDFESYFSGNTVQICPVGALTGTQYRFQARPFDLVSSPSVCEHCSAGCAQRTDHRRGKVLRRLAGDDAEVNAEWNCDKGRWAFDYVNTDNRILTPLVRGDDGELHEASWPDALRAAAAGLKRAKGAGGVGVLTGGRLTVEDAYAYSKFARLALDTNDIDFRARPHSDEEATFLGNAVAGIHPASGAVTYSEVDKAPAVLIAGLETEEECPILFLRLRKANRDTGLKPYVVAPFATRGTEKFGGELIPTVPGGEAALLSGYADGGDMSDTLRAPGSLILVGERLATVPGALTAAARLAKATGAKLAWVPRRAGDRGAVDTGLLPTLLPGGGEVDNDAARDALASYWDVEALPGQPGRDTNAILAAAADRELGGLLIAGVDPFDLPDPSAAEAALYTANFIVSVEQRHTAVTRRAAVVLPIATVPEKDGAYLNWEGRLRTFEAAIDSSLMSDYQVLDALGAAMGVELGFESLAKVRGELAGVPEPAARAAAPLVSAEAVVTPAEGNAVLATWHHLLDSGTLQDNNTHLAGTAATPVVRLSHGTAASIGAAEGQPVTVASSSGGITLPLAVTRMPDGVVWLPTNSPGSGVYRGLGVAAGDIVSIATYNGGNRD